jgi:hypothetical protein
MHPGIASRAPKRVISPVAGEADSDGGPHVRWYLILLTCVTALAIVSWLSVVL